MEFFKFYNEKPAKEVLEADLDEFMMKRSKKFPGDVKVGKTMWRRIQSRYKISSRYEILSADHIFAKCSNEELALSIEKMCQHHLISQERLIPEAVKKQGSRGNEDQCCAVYVTKLKENLYVCPVPNCRVTTSKNIVEKHMASHPLIADSIKANKLLTSIGSTHRISVDPIKVTSYIFFNEVKEQIFKVFFFFFFLNL
jgi:hypothetical protein